MTVNRTAVLFPGQGAYFPGALSDIHRSFPEEASALAEIDEVARQFLGRPVSDHLITQAGKSIDELLTDDPDMLQLAIYATSVVAYRVLRARGLDPAVVIGHSLGEIAALVAAGAFTLDEGAQIVCHRNAALRNAGVADGAMAALSADTVRAEQILGLLGDPETVVAVENFTGQTVISGRSKTVEAAAAIAAVLRIGARTLRSPYAFHSPLLTTAAEDFADRIRHLSQRPLQREVYSPIRGRAYLDSDDLTAELAGHLTGRVSFAEAIRAVRSGGVDVFVECGAGDVLTKIVRRIVPDSEVVTTPSLLSGSSITTAISALTEAGVIPVDGLTEALHRAFAPDVDPAVFDRFWRHHGPRVVDYVRAELAAPPSVVPAPPPDAEAATPIATSERRSRSEVLTSLVTLYADALEYPEEVFEENTDLEAELGVDSVKQTELLARAGEQWGLPPQPSDFKVGDHNTLGRIADMIAAA